MENRERNVTVDELAEFIKSRKGEFIIHVELEGEENDAGERGCVSSGSGIGTLE